MNTGDYKFDADEATKHQEFFKQPMEGRKFTVEECIQLRDIHDREEKWHTEHQGDNYSDSK